MPGALKSFCSEGERFRNPPRLAKGTPMISALVKACFCAGVRFRLRLALIPSITLSNFSYPPLGEERFTKTLLSPSMVIRRAFSSFNMSEETE
jgi:hypothetical protein